MVNLFKNIYKNSAKELYSVLVVNTTFLVMVLYHLILDKYKYLAGQDVVPPCQDKIVDR